MALHKAPVQTVDYDDLFVIVSETDDSKPIATRDGALAHDCVVRSVLAKTTPLPFRFGTLVSPDRLDEFVGFHREKLLRSLGKVSGCVEMSFKALRKGELFDAETALQETAPAGPGTLFMESRRRVYIAQESFGLQAERFAHQLATHLKGCVVDAAVNLNPSEMIFLSAGHLVRRENELEYKRRIEEMHKPEIEVLVSGPWAPYSFSDL